MSISWWPPTSTTEVHHCLVRHLPFRQNNVSSTPTASTVPTRSASASKSASPQRRTSSLTVCQSQPSSSATSWTGRPDRPTWTVTHRAARDVSNARWGPIVGSCSMNDLIAHSGFGHVQRRFRHRSRTGVKAERRQIHQQGGAIPLGPHRSATCLTGGAGHAGTDHHHQGFPSPRSSIPTNSTSPRPTNFSLMRVGSVSTGVLLPRMSFSNSRLWRAPPHFWWIPNPLPDPLLPPHFRRADNPRFSRRIRGL